MKTEIKEELKLMIKSFFGFSLIYAFLIILSVIPLFYKNASLEIKMHFALSALIMLCFMEENWMNKYHILKYHSKKVHGKNDRRRDL